MSIGIIDYGVGNIGSLSNAFYSQGWDPILISSPENFKDISHLIIPGVGSYSSAIQTLAERKLYDLIVNFSITKDRKKVNYFAFEKTVVFYIFSP